MPPLHQRREHSPSSEALEPEANSPVLPLPFFHMDVPFRTGENSALNCSGFTTEPLTAATHRVCNDITRREAGRSDRSLAFGVGEGALSEPRTFCSY